jgi:hypothetical protein
LRDAAPTPADLTITVRDERFNRGTSPRRWWAGEPFGTAWHNALSATFPRGEAFFIEAVKAHREGANPKLESEIRAFVKQEINHTREHIAFNRLAEDAGYDIKTIDARVAELLALTKGRPAIANLAVTMALEHYTAMMAAEFLANPKHFAAADKEVRDMWRWHAAEEIEHKGVAFDTWNHATKDWHHRLEGEVGPVQISHRQPGHRAPDIPRVAGLFQAGLPPVGSRRPRIDQALRRRFQ